MLRYWACALATGACIAAAAAIAAAPDSRDHHAGAGIEALPDSDWLPAGAVGVLPAPGAPPPGVVCRSPEHPHRPETGRSR